MTILEIVGRNEEIDCGYEVFWARLYEKVPESGNLTIPGHPKTSFGRTFLPEQAAVPIAQRKRENNHTISTHSPHLQEQRWKSPRQLDRHPPKGKKKIAFLFF